jgi:5-methyltetrahydrofolate--homocysteine methyltransferase
MLIVGELINSSRKSIADFIETKDSAAIGAVAKAQKDAGADYLDVNAGVFVDNEAQYLQWLVKSVQSAVNAPCCIDSPDPRAIETALNVHQGAAMINSISLEKAKLGNLLPVIAHADTDLKVVALCMSDEGMPETSEQRLRIADKLINRLAAAHVPPENIYVDPLVQPIATNGIFGREFLDAVTRIREEFEEVHTICGLSNISFGLPERRLLNQTFMVMAIRSGLDSAIVNPLDRRMMAAITASETLTGKDDFCMNYLRAWRGGKFEFMNMKLRFQEFKKDIP